MPFRGFKIVLVDYLIKLKAITCTNSNLCDNINLYLFYFIAMHQPFILDLKYC